MYAKDPYEAKFQYLITKCKRGLNHFLIAFDDMIGDMINNKKLSSIVTEVFITDRKLNIPLVFITQPYFKVSKNVRLNFTHFKHSK